MKKQLEILAKELETLSLEELDRRAANYLSMDQKILAIYQNEYLKRGAQFPSQEMMDH